MSVPACDPTKRDRRHFAVRLCCSSHRITRRVPGRSHRCDSRHSLGAIGPFHSCAVASGANSVFAFWVRRKLRARQTPLGLADCLCYLHYWMFCHSHTPVLTAKQQAIQASVVEDSVPTGQRVRYQLSSSPIAFKTRHRMPDVPIRCTRNRGPRDLVRFVSFVAAR